MIEGFNPRVVANYIIKTRNHLGRDTTNLELQKLLFFAHSNYLLGVGQRLVSGYFEAWQYGPVHPVVYKSFSQFGGQPILSYAEQRDPFTKCITDLPDLKGTMAKESITATVANLSKLTAGQLVDLSHRESGAWYETVQMANAGHVLGMRITNETIIACAKRTKLVHFAINSQNTQNFSQKEKVRHYVEQLITDY